MTTPNPFAPPSTTTTQPAPAPSAGPDPTGPYAASPWTGAPTAPGYGQPYGQQPYQPYGQPYPGQPYQPYGQPFQPPVNPYVKPAHLRTGLAQGALYTGLGALVCAPLTVGVLGVAGGLVALVLGVVALRRVRAQQGGGRGQAWWGIVLATLASALGVLIFLTVGPEAADDLEESWDEGWEAGEAGADGASDDDGTGQDARDAIWDEGYDAGYQDGYSGARSPIPAPGAEGSDIDPADVPQHLFGEPATVGVFQVTVLDVNLGADDLVMPAFPGNVEPEGRYVMATVSVTNTGSEPARPAFDLYHYYQGDDDLMYGDWTCQSWTPRPLLDVGPLAPGETVEYDVCFDVPVVALGLPMLVIDDARSDVATLTQWRATDAY